ncbi:Crp/Fnr family transcriptional regulator [Aquimarina sp. TRL1]|uniref:Crp/Fnr family transcriptional regulator n=1 Tax=Aquimarina sp. (strain TRL1) TaxID=2736252 RepID=UPI00158A7B2C|nr:Crp/Fnr family transcriptional regulator [Aquimarina sp. TRL1]QKX07044.1 Crp/Fnr family transcriptional regulator [Aquimarina sp. TRL1]
MELELRREYGNIFEEELIREIIQVSVYKEVPAGVTMMEIGQYVKAMPLILQGAIKILRNDKEGDELLLYFLEKGDTCAMTLNCCLGETKSEIRAITEKKTQLLMIPIEKMEEWTSRFKSWRTFVFQSYHNRLMEMLEAIDNIAFYKMDERLLKYLKESSKVHDSTIVHHTHQEIAYDLHTSRVVVSRILKKLENQGKIFLNRNSIQLLFN